MNLDHAARPGASQFDGLNAGTRRSFIFPRKAVKMLGIMTDIVAEVRDPEEAKGLGKIEGGEQDLAVGASANVIPAPPTPSTTLPAVDTTTAKSLSALGSASRPSSRPTSPSCSVSDSAISQLYRPLSEDSVVVSSPNTPPQAARRPSALTVSPEKDYKLTRSISASITAVLANPPRPAASSGRIASASQVSQAPSSATSSSRKPYFMTSAYSRARQAEQQKTNSHEADSPTSNISPRAAHAHIVDTTNKRLATLEYMRKVYDSDVYYFNTISHNQSQLSSLPSLTAGRVGRRATNYLLLGTSIPPLLALHAHNPLEYLRALTNLINEFDTYCSLSSEPSNSSRGRVGQMLKSGMRGVKSRRTSGAADSIMSPDALSLNGSSMTLANPPLSPLDITSPTTAHHVINTAGHEFNYLQTPNLPFDPDFNTSFATLIDVLSDTYGDLMTLLAPPDSCTVAVVEAYAKADKALRKTLINSMTNEMAESARKETKVEVGGLGKMVLSGLI